MQFANAGFWIQFLPKSQSFISFVGLPWTMAEAPGIRALRLRHCWREERATPWFVIACLARCPWPAKRVGSSLLAGKNSSSKPVCFKLLFLIGLQEEKGKAFELTC